MKFLRTKYIISIFQAYIMENAWHKCEWNLFGRGVSAGCGSVSKSKWVPRSRRMLRSLYVKALATVHFLMSSNMLFVVVVAGRLKNSPTLSNLFFRLWKPKFQPMDMAITVPPFCVEDLLFVNLYSSLRDVKNKQINQYSWNSAALTLNGNQSNQSINIAKEKQ